MFNISILITALFGLGIASGANALDVPCADNYSPYREKLIDRNWSPYPCYLKN